MCVRSVNFVSHFYQNKHWNISSYSRNDKIKKTKQNCEFCLPLKFKSSLSVIVRHLNVSVNSRSLIADVKLIIYTHLKFQIHFINCYHSNVVVVNYRSINAVAEMVIGIWQFLYNLFSIYCLKRKTLFVTNTYSHK